jgi:hypothetical protein
MPTANKTVADAPTPSLTLLFRAFGRFCLIPEGRISDGDDRYERAHLVGVRLDKNPGLGFETHFMTMAVPLACLKFFTRRPDMTAHSTHAHPRDVDEIYLWNLAGCDVSVSGEREGVVTVPGPNPNEDLPNLNELVPAGKAVLAQTFYKDRAKSAADCVVTVEAGTVTPMSPMGARQIEYHPFDPSLPPSGITRDLAEGIAIAIPTTGAEVTLNIKRRTDNARWSVTLEQDVFTKADPVVTFGNTCGCVSNADVASRDPEFAAYYELLAEPGATKQRLIPVLRDGFVSSPSCDVPAILRP